MLSSVDERASTRISPSSGDMIEHGIVPITAVGLVVVEIRTIAEAPANTARLHWSANVAAIPGFLQGLSFLQRPPDR